MKKKSSQNKLYWMDNESYLPSAKMENGCVFSVLHAIFLLCLMPISSLKKVNFGHCVISMDMYEIRKGFGEIKEMTQAQDQYTNIRLLHRPYSLQETKTEDRCCFFHYLLNFYLANVFNQCQSHSNFHQRRVSRIANNFLSVKKELTLCVSYSSRKSVASL
uniref:Uncharacterized protein n=1 Tax=Sphaerodactylus townsendi TaxID=933632 RepID=A0ACB8F4P0_9SAUR